MNEIIDRSDKVYVKDIEKANRIMFKLPPPSTIPKVTLDIMDHANQLTHNNNVNIANKFRYGDDKCNNDNNNNNDNNCKK